MAFCPNCGAQVEGRYCAKCGTAVDPAAPVAPAAAPVPVVSAAGLPENTAAALCYLLGLITGILFLVLEPYSKNKLIRFHAFQSIFLHVAVIIVWVAFRTVLPWTMWYLVSLIDLAFFVLWIFMLVQTYQGKKIVLPVIGDLAAKQA
jgi:uncharacterized membrane protein